MQNSLFYRALFQKRPMFWGSLLIVATSWISFECLTLLIHVCDVTRPIYVCDVTCRYVWLDSFICGGTTLSLICPVDMCDMSHWYVLNVILLRVDVIHHILTCRHAWHVSYMCVAVSCNVCRSILECVTACCGVLQCDAQTHLVISYHFVLQYVVVCAVVCYSVLQCVTVCCSVLQCDTQTHLVISYHFCK